MTDFDFNIPYVLLAHEYNYPPHFMYDDYIEGRKFSGIIFAISGSAEYVLRDAAFRIHEGQIMFIPEGTSYKVMNPSDKIPFHHYTVNFKLSFEKGNLDTLGLTAIDTRQPQMYDNLFEQISSAWFDKRPGFMALCKSYLFNILFNFFTEYFNSNVNHNLIDRVMPAKNYIDRYYMRRITLEELSEMCGMSCTNFRRIYKEAFEYSPIEYLIELRISKAKDLLMCKYYHVREVSDMVGYNDFSYFSRIFKEHVGVSPTDFKRIH